MRTNQSISNWLKMTPKAITVATKISTCPKSCPIIDANIRVLMLDKEYDCHTVRVQEDNSVDAAMLLTSIKTIASHEVEEELQLSSSSSTCQNPGSKSEDTNDWMMNRKMRAVSFDANHQPDDYKCTSLTKNYYWSPSSPSSPEPTDYEALTDVTPVTPTLDDRSGKPHAVSFSRFDAITSLCDAALVSPIQKGRRKRTLDGFSGTESNEGHNKKKVILHRKFSWRNCPELEAFLVANREEYLRHSTLNYTVQQKNFNNRLTEQLIEHASKHGYIFDENFFNFVLIRDRIRCYFKSYVQSNKKRGVVIGYAAKKAGLITKEDLEQSASTSGRIVLPP